MNQLLDKFKAAVASIEAERGSFLLCGLFRRHDASDFWDFVVSAPWIDQSRLEGMRYIANKLGDFLDPDEILILSRIVPMQTKDQSVIDLADSVSESKLPMIIARFTFAGAEIDEAYLISAGQKMSDSYSGKMQTS